MAIVSSVLKSVATPMEGCNLAVLQDLLSQIDTGNLDFYEKTGNFKLSIKMADFNLLKFDNVLYTKLNLPFQITVMNNTFMKTNVFRLVSRKLPNTINWFSNIEFPFDVEIGQSASFIIYIAIDSLDDIDWLIDNDMAFMLYTDNTTLSEIDFAIRVPDIRGIVQYQNPRDNTLSLDEQYLQGIFELEDLLPKAFKLDDEAKVYNKLKDFQNFIDLSSDSTYGKAAMESVLSDIQDNNKLTNLRGASLPSDFVHNIINMRESKSFRDKFRFNLIRFTYYEGVIDQTLNIGFDEARSYFNSWRNSNQSKINTNIDSMDVSTQQENLDGLVFMVRIPFFGSELMYYDAVFYVVNIRSRHLTIVDNHDMGKFTGDFIRLSEVFNENPNINSLTLQYDISSQVKENLTTFQSFEAPNYAKPTDSTTSLGFKIVGATIDVSCPSTLIDETDITLSYYHTNPILSYKKNWVVYEHSDDFRTKLVNYDWNTYFDITSGAMFPEDNSIVLYSVDYTVEKQIWNDISSDWTAAGVDWTISNSIGITVSNQIKHSFRILSTKNISNGSSTLLLADATKSMDIVYIDKIEIFNDGNTFLSVSDAQLFWPNGRWYFSDKWENQWGSDMVKQDQMSNDVDFYRSMFDSENPVNIMSFNTLAPGETGDLYVVYYLNRSMLNTYLAEFFNIPIYLRIEFDGTMSAFFCHFDTGNFRSISRYNNYSFSTRIRNELGCYPYNIQMLNELDPAPADPWPNYTLASGGSIDISNIYWKSQFHYDVAFYSGATVKSNKDGTSYIDMNNAEPYSNGLLKNGRFTPFSWMFTFPTPNNPAKLTTISDLVNLYDMVQPSDLNYKFYIMKFETFFNSIIQDIKDKYYLISFVGIYNSNNASKLDTIYFRYDVSNEYEWFNYELKSIDHDTYPFDLKQLEQFVATVTLNVPETQLNVFNIQIPKPLSFVNASAIVNDVIGQFLSGTSTEAQHDALMGKSINPEEYKRLSGSGSRQYLSDRYHTIFDMGEIIGNKQMTMNISTKYFNLFRIKSFANFEVKNQAIGPGLPDVYSVRIIDPNLEYAQMVFEFFKHDYTVDYIWEHKVEESIIQNSGNYIITPSYMDLQYLPIDETYSMMVTVKNQNPYNTALSILPMDTETANAIQLMGFPDNEDYNKIYLHLVTLGQPYSMLPNEEVKMFFRIIPRRIGMNFFTLYLKLNNAIRPLNFEFRSFINQKAYFVLDEDSKTVDFGDVPIGKFVESPVTVKNIGNVVGKINSIYTFGNDAKYFKLLDRDKGNELSDRITYNKVVRPRTSLSIPIRFFSQSYGFNYSYCYIETNEPVLEDAQWFEGDPEGTDFTQLYRNAPKYLVSLLKAQSVIEDQAIETDSYIFLGYVNPLTSKFRSYEISIRNKNRNKVVSVFKITNLMKNYVKVKYTREPFSTQSSVWLQLNPRGYTEGWYYDELQVQMMVYDKNTKQSNFILNKIPVSWYVTREQRLAMDVDLEEINFSSKPFLKAFKKVNIRNYSNEDATLYMNLLTDHSGLFTLIPDLSDETVVISEGINFSFLITFGGDQRFIGAYNTMLTIQLTLGDETITKFVPIMGVVGDENIVKFYRRNQIIVTS